VHAAPKTAELWGHIAKAPPALSDPPAAPEAEESVPSVGSARLSEPAAAVPSVLLAVPAAALDAANAGKVICCAKIAAVAANIPAITSVAIIVFLIYIEKCMGKHAIKEVPSSANGLGLDQLLDICKNISKQTTMSWL
jgi:hypothetical protein